jgi:hypothetical protein
MSGPAKATVSESLVPKLRPDAVDTALTEALMNTFPASDPYSLSFTPSKK